MRRLTITGIAAAALLALASCSRPAPPARGPASYLAVSDSAVTIIAWRATPSGHVRGTVTTSNAAGSAPGETLSVHRAPFTGTVRGSSVTLLFPTPLFLHDSAHGTLSGGTLRLGLAQPDGTLKGVRLNESEPARYHREVAALSRTINRANAQVASQLTGHPQRQVSAHEEQIALSALRRDSRLTPDGVLPRILARFASDAATARADLDTEKHIAAGSNRYCKAAFSVGGAAQKVGGDLNALQGDVATMEPAIANIRAEMASARVAMRQLAKAGLDAPNSAADMISGAQSNVRLVIARANSHVDQVNAIGAAARSIANNIDAGRCSGARIGTWVQPISRVKLLAQVDQPKRYSWAAEASSSASSSASRRASILRRSATRARVSTWRGSSSEQQSWSGSSDRLKVAILRASAMISVLSYPIRGRRIGSMTASSSAVMFARVWLLT